MDEKITIIEGPPPTFEAVAEGWAYGLIESPTLSDVVVTRLRTFNGPALVERCYRAWRQQQTVYLEFRTSDGLESRAPIVAARSLETDDGQLLLLYVRLASDDIEVELDFEDDDEDEYLDFEDGEEYLSPDDADNYGDTNIFRDHLLGTGINPADIFGDDDENNEDVDPDAFYDDPDVSDADLLP